MTDFIVPFEERSNKNGIVYWWASDMMPMLGYTNKQSFLRVLDKATKAFITLRIPHHENIIPTERDFNGKTKTDFKLTRFACYLIAMNANPKYPQVATLQAYLAAQAEAFRLIVEQDEEHLDRLLIREELVDGNKSLASAAKQAGVSNYAAFQNAGYLGMYNRTAGQLKALRGISKDLFDTMGRSELAANLFRVTQTEERIKSQSITGQAALEATHHHVGAEVRRFVIANTGQNPEELDQKEAIPEIKRELKEGYRGMKKLDKKKK